MSKKTEINPMLNATVINPELGEATVLNPGLFVVSEELTEGTLIGGKYKIKNKLDVSTGEADLFLCSYCDGECVAKVYRRQRAIKPEVIDALKSIDSPYIAKVYHAGVYNSRQFEIIPYYRNGSLLGRKFTLDELKDTIIPCINEALRVLHENDVIHKDLKPSNIMLNDDGKSVSLIDFGVSSVADDGNTVLLTKTGMTPEYSAPETFRNLFLDESDYYSLGITVFELYCGYTPYRNMTADEIARFTAVQRIPFPKDMPRGLQELIAGVTYADITNRNNKQNPNRRWTYDEVSKWLRGIKQVIPGESSEVQNTIPPYTFLGYGYKDIPSLTIALAANWNDGKKQLYRGLLSAFFKNFNPEIAGFCMDAEEEANESSGREDIIFRNLLYRINPELDAFCWLGRTYESFPAFGRDMLDKLWKNDTSDYEYWDSILENRLLTDQLGILKVRNDELTDAVSAIEASHRMDDRSEREKLMNYYCMAYILSGRKSINIADTEIDSIQALAGYMNSLASSSYDELRDFCNRLIYADGTLELCFEAWLISLGKRKEINEWRSRISSAL